ncbi:MAG: alcohol dehydrogenase catalytic domain-containing protein [Tannerella sp.]|jgi:(R,R)-butanediol dehydrogenase/meso-butanediol dehydrogenase/diacetyl reductase/L-iditol 2-dehydrogenase|nr:alcohol dehydrogenase catalytic domain-containing protein [Tannerella sp.]
MKLLAVTRLGDMKKNIKGEIGIVDAPMPKPGPADVLIKVAYCAICGSDPHLINGAFPIPIPFGLGHEASGTVVELGEKAVKKGLKVGDRVAGNFVKFCGSCYYCRNGQEQFCPYMNETVVPGMAEYMVWDESQVYKIPDSVSLRKACLTEPVAIALRAVERADIRVGAKVAVSGAGGMGLIISQLAKASGASTVTVIETVGEKRKTAKELGADYVINPLEQNIVTEAMRVTDGIGFDSVIEASGAPAAVEPALNSLAKGGTIVCFSMYPPDYTLPLNLFQQTYLKEVTIRGFYMSPYSFPRAIALLQKLDLDKVIQAEFPLESGADAFAAHATGKYGKVIINCLEQGGR